MAKMMSKEERDEARKRCESATEGPWVVNGKSGRVYNGNGERPFLISSSKLWADSRFIAHARHDLPQALDALDAKDVEIERLRSNDLEEYSARCIVGKIAALVESETATADQVRELLGDLETTEPELLPGSTLAPFKVDAGHYMAGVFARCFAEVLRSMDAEGGMAVELSPAHWPEDERLTVTIAYHGTEIPAEAVKRLRAERDRYRQSLEGGEDE